MDIHTLISSVLTSICQHLSLVCIFHIAWFLPHCKTNWLTKRTDWMCPPVFQCTCASSLSSLKTSDALLRFVSPLQGWYIQQKPTCVFPLLDYCEADCPPTQLLRNLTGLHRTCHDRQDLKRLTSFRKWLALTARGEESNKLFWQLSLNPSLVSHPSRS